MLVHLTTRVRRIITFAVVAMMMFASLLAPSPTLAQSQTIQSTLTGVTISYGPPYELQEDGRYSDDMTETMMFLGPTDILAMGFMTPLIDLNGARDIMLEALFGEIGSASTIDRGDYTGVSYSLDMLNIDGMEMGVFSLFMNQRAHGFSEFYIFIAPPSVFGSSMQTAQNSFTIDGTQLMDGVDASAMGNMVTANIGITGGTAVTDVTDVAENTSETSQTETTQTDTGATSTGTLETGTEQGDRIAYLLEVTFEFGAVDQSLLNVVTAIDDLGSDRITAQEGRVVMDEEFAFLAGTNDRIAAIEVPANMQTFHQEVVAWGNAVTHAGDMWFAAVDGTANQEEAFGALETAVQVHVEFSDTLQAENMAEANTTQDTGTTESTGAETQTTTTAGDGDSYIEGVQTHRAAFLGSLGTWSSSLDSLPENPTDADLQRVREATIAEAEYWVTFAAAAQNLTPPAGYENVHAQYLVWADEVTELGNLWIGSMSGQQTDSAVFSNQLDVVIAADEQLAAEIEAAGSGSTETSSTASEGSRTTESTSGRTSRTSTTSDSGNTSETTGRTSRTSTSTTPDETSETTESGTGTSRTTRGSGSTSGNTSETSGQTESTTEASSNEWLMEISGVTVTWSDDFSLSDRVDDPQSSDVERGEDRIELTTTSSDGLDVPFSVTVYENDGPDSTGLPGTLVDDPSLVTELYGDTAEVIEYEITGPESGVLVWAEDEIGQYYVYVQVTCVTDNCDTVALLILPSEGYPMLDALEAMETGVAVDGVPVSTAIPLDYLEEVVNELGT